MLPWIDAQCDSTSCWCHWWPPIRQVLSTGAYYTVEETAPGLYRYKYLTEAEARALAARGLTPTA